MNPNNRNNPNRNPFRGIIPYLLILFVIIGSLQMFSGPSGFMGQTNEIPSSQFFQELEDGNIEKFTIQIGSGVYEVKGNYRAQEGTETSEEDNFIQVIQGSNTFNTF